MKQISRDNVITTYKFYAPLYDRLFGAVLEPGRRALTEVVNSLMPSSILEVGVGTGLTLAQYPATSTVAGIDLSTDMLHIAQKRATQLQDRDIRLAAMDAENIGFPDNFFDCITVPYVLSVTPNPSKLINEIRRVCRKDGTILIVNHFSGSQFWWVLERTVRSLASRVGFRSDFSFEEHILSHDWHIQSVKQVNLFGLSKLVVIRNR